MLNKFLIAGARTAFITPLVLTYAGISALSAQVTYQNYISQEVQQTTKRHVVAASEDMLRWVRSEDNSGLQRAIAQLEAAQQYVQQEQNKGKDTGLWAVGGVSKLEAALDSARTIKSALNEGPTATQLVLGNRKALAAPVTGLSMMKQYSFGLDSVGIGILATSAFFLGALITGTDGYLWVRETFKKQPAAP